MENDSLLQIEFFNDWKEKIAFLEYKKIISRNNFFEYREMA